MSRQPSKGGQFIALLCFVVMYVTKSHVSERVVLHLEASIMKKEVGIPGSASYGLSAISCHDVGNTMILFKVGGAKKSVAQPFTVFSATQEMPTQHKKELLGAV